MLTVCVFCDFRVTSSENYFLSELAYAAETKLTNCKPLLLHVMTLGDNSARAQSEITDEYQQKLPSAPDVHHVIMESGGCGHALPSSSSDCCIMTDRSKEMPAGNQSHLGDNSDSSTKAERDFADVENAVCQLSQMLTHQSKSDCFILDIDLDFFSTMNPFLTSLSELQYCLLLELYAYRPPLDRSVEVCLVTSLCK